MDENLYDTLASLCLHGQGAYTVHWIFVLRPKRRKKERREEREERRTRSTRGGKQTLVQKEQNVNIVDDGKDDDEGCGTSENITGIDK